jgi:hypothetical protein
MIHFIARQHEYCDPESRFDHSSTPECQLLSTTLCTNITLEPAFDIERRDLVIFRSCSTRVCANLISPRDFKVNRL